MSSSTELRNFKRHMALAEVATEPTWIEYHLSFARYHLTQWELHCRRERAEAHWKQFNANEKAIRERASTLSAGSD